VQAHPEKDWNWNLAGLSRNVFNKFVSGKELK